MGKYDRMRILLYNKYVKNLNLVAEILGLNLKDTFVCPLCFESFLPEQINMLRPEHIPPQKLGGKNIECTLTCQKCNHSTGIAEGRLAEFINFRNVINKVPNTSAPIRYRLLKIKGGIISETPSLPAIYRQMENEIIIDGLPSNPRDLENVI
jgi:hypothetical protein